MSRDMDYRMQELLFRFPLFAHLSEDDTLRVLLRFSDRTLCLSAFKAVYWCAVFGKRVHIDVQTEDVFSLEQEFCREMPWLMKKRFEAYASFSFLSTAERRAPFYDYVITDDAELTLGMRGNALFALYDETASDALCAVRNDGVLRTVFGNGMALNSEYQRVRAELERLSVNIDFVYALHDSEKASYQAVRDRFRSDPYRQASSHAAAVHIPYKLFLCGKENALSHPNLDRAIEVQDSLYHKLIECEHDRWCAYMLTEGWRAPTDAELAFYAYKDGRDHKNKEEKQHPCLCPWGGSPMFSVKGNGAWLDEDLDAETLSALDRVSFRCYRLAAEEAKRKMPEIHQRIREIEGTEYKKNILVQNYLASCRKLCHDEENSLSLYEGAQKHLKKYISDPMFDELDAALRVVKIRNKREDFARIDGFLIDMLPFTLLYGVQYHVSIHVSGENPLVDIMIPHLLSCQRAYYLTKGRDPDYEKTLQAYFAERGGNVKVTVLPTLREEDSAKDITAQLEALIRKEGLSPSAFILSCTDKENTAAQVAVGKIAASLGGADAPVHIAEYKNGRSVLDVDTGKSLVAGLLKRKLSCDELVSLTNGTYTNPFEFIGSQEELTKMVEIFGKYSDEKTIETEKESGNRKYLTEISVNVWSRAQELFTRMGSARKIDFRKYNKPPREKLALYETESARYKTSGLKAFLEELSRLRLVSDLTVRERGGKTMIYLTCYDEIIDDAIREFSELKDRDATIRLIVTENCIRIADKEIRGVRVLENDDPKLLKLYKIKLLYDLLHLNVIEELRFERGELPFTEAEIDEWLLLPYEKVPDIGRELAASFTFRSMSLKWLFQIPGRIFELYLYNKMVGLGEFYDVQTNVKISWNSHVKIESNKVKMEEKLQNAKDYGLAAYNKVFSALEQEQRKKLFDYRTLIPRNEIDVVLTNYMEMIFISCKTGTKIKTEWLYEIASVSARFHAIPVLAVSMDLERLMSSAADDIARARSMGISLIGSETFSDDARFAYAMRQIKEGHVIIGLETTEAKGE